MIDIFIETEVFIYCKSFQNDNTLPKNLTFAALIKERFIKQNDIKICSLTRI